MDREEVKRNNLVDRYLLGQLSEDEADEFEAYYLGSPETVAELETTEALLTGLRRSPQGGGKVAALRPAPAWSARAGQWFGLAASVVAAVSLVFAFQSRSALEQARSGSAPAAIDVPINIPIVTLAATRSAGPGADAPAAVIELPAGAGYVALALDLGLPEASGYRVTLLGEDGGQVWSAGGLVPDEMDSLTLALPARLLEPGVYRLRATPEEGAGNAVEYPFEVVTQER